MTPHRLPKAAIPTHSSDSSGSTSLARSLADARTPLPLPLGSPPHSHPPTHPLVLHLHLSSLLTLTLTMATLSAPSPKGVDASARQRGQTAVVSHLPGLTCYPRSDSSTFIPIRTVTLCCMRDGASFCADSVGLQVGYYWRRCQGYAK